MMKKLKNNKGFTLIEILAAMILLAIVAIPLGKTFIDGFRFQARGQVKTEANKVIEYVTERIKNEQYGKKSNTTEPDYEETVDEFEEPFDSNFEKMLYKFSEPGITSFDINVDKLPGSKVSAEYGVKIEEISAGKVQAGGIGTPDKYDLKVLIKDSEFEIIDFEDEFGNSTKKLICNANYTDKLLEIRETNDSGPFNVLIEDGRLSGSTTFNIQVLKKITENVKFYIKGDVELSEYFDSTLTREQKAFERIKLGDKDELEDETEYLCEAKITATNKNDDSITASMNVTFSIFIENVSDEDDED